MKTKKKEPERGLRPPESQAQAVSPTEIWSLLTPPQQQVIFQALVQTCHYLVQNGCREENNDK